MIDLGDLYGQVAFVMSVANLDEAILVPKLETKSEKHIAYSIEELLYKKSSEQAFKKKFIRLQQEVKTNNWNNDVISVIIKYMDCNDVKDYKEQSYQAAEQICILAFRLLYNEEKMLYELGNNITLTNNQIKYEGMLLKHKRDIDNKKEIPNWLIKKMPKIDCHPLMIKLRILQLYRISSYRDFYWDDKVRSQLLEFFMEEFVSNEMQVEKCTYSNVHTGSGEIHGELVDNFKRSRFLRDAIYETIDEEYNFKIKSYEIVSGKRQTLLSIILGMGIKMALIMDVKKHEIVCQHTAVRDEILRGIDKRYRNVITGETKIDDTFGIERLAIVALENYIDLLSADEEELVKSKRLRVIDMSNFDTKQVRIEPHLMKLPKGSEISEEAKHLAEEFNFEVPYGCTFVRPFNKSVRTTIK